MSVIIGGGSDPARNVRRTDPSKAHKVLGTKNILKGLGTSLDLISPPELRPWYRRWPDWEDIKSYPGKLYKKLGIKHLIPAMIIVAYTIVGGGMFVALERSSDTSARAEVAWLLAEGRNASLAQFQEVLSNFSFAATGERFGPSNAFFEHFASMLEGALDDHETRMTDVTGCAFSSETIWDIWNSMYFCGTLYTTIGYGNIACATPAGRIISIIYALIGIPLVLSAMNDLGTFLFNTVDKTLKSIDYFMSGVWLPTCVSLRIERCRKKMIARRRRRLTKDFSFEVSIYSEDIELGGDRSLIEDAWKAEVASRTSSEKERLQVPGQIPTVEVQV